MYVLPLWYITEEFLVKNLSILHSDDSKLYKTFCLNIKPIINTITASAKKEPAFNTHYLGTAKYSFRLLQSHLHHHNVNVNRAEFCIQARESLQESNSREHTGGFTQPDSHRKG